MNTPTQDQLLNAAIMLDGAHPAVAAWLVRMAEQPAAEPAIEVEISPMSTGGTTATVWSHRLPVGTHKLYTHPAPTQQPLTEEMVVAAARMLSDRQAAACNVDCGDMWKLHGNDFIDDARAALGAAHGITGSKKGGAA